MLPVLYSFRRCPYAIRARMVLFYAGINIELREILLKNKPTAMLDLSSKGTVPLLISLDGTVLDESYDIMRWALKRNDPDSWYTPAKSAEIDDLIKKNDTLFKDSLDRYKYSNRYPENSMEYYRSQAEIYLISLEKKLIASNYLLGDSISLADVAIFPFIRQFSLVDKVWFEASPYLNLRRWLNNFLDSKNFFAVMKKEDIWKQENNKSASMIKI